MVNFASFWKTEACGITVLPDIKLEISGPNLLNAVRFHTCTKIDYKGDTYIIAVAGFDHTNKDTKTTQILNTKDTTWFYGKTIFLINLILSTAKNKSKTEFSTNWFSAKLNCQLSQQNWGFIKLNFQQNWVLNNEQTEFSANRFSAFSRLFDFLGPNFPINLRLAMPISFPTPLQDEVLWILGGRGGRGNTADGQYDSIYKLVCQSKPGTSPGCQWEKSEQKLKQKRNNGAVVTL